VGNNNQCTAKALGNLANAKGLCPEVPSTEGGYGIAGLAYGPKTIDLRPNYAAQRDSRWGGATPINEDWALRQPLNTYAVQLAESLPSFSVPVGANGNITLLPACMANSNGNPGAWNAAAAGWRNCSLTNLIVDTNVAMADVGTVATAREKTCSGNGTTSQCFTVAWEDSTWGNDYDMDGIQRLGYCVGGACQTFKMLCPTTASATATVGPWAGVAADQMVIATCAVQAVADHTLTFGYTVTGSTVDGVSLPIYRRGTRNFTIGQVKPADGNVSAANAVTFTQGVSAAGLLKNPLWYAAKYGGFTESTPGAGTPKPDVAAEWDAVNNTTGAAGADGVPDSYFDVKNPANLQTAMATIFDAASEPDASAASVATNSTNLKIESRVYQAKFSSADWSGQLLSFKINTQGVLTPVAEWDAGALINLQDYQTGREIITKGAGDGVAFDYNVLSAGQQALLDQVTVGVNVLVDGCGPERVAYLRGDDSHEGTSGTFDCAAGVANPVAKFRVRATSKLGDIVNSNPWYVGKPSAGYSDVDQPGYSAFRAANLNRTPMVYVGGNDGMLHGFNASLQWDANVDVDPTVDSDGDGVPNNDHDGDFVPTGNSGQEVIAYVPTPVYANLSSLTHRIYNKNHKYFVDGSPLIGDADLDAGAANLWRSVLVGGLGGGGKGYYALDVTNPANLDEANAADILLWEFTAGDDVDMGHAFNHPPAHLATGRPKQMVKMPNGKWAVALGNGYNSTNGVAALYIVFIEEGVDGVWTAGSDYIKIVADNAGGNGLSTPVPFDMTGDGVVDVVYAGDLKGNLWKFKVEDPDPANWQVAFSAANCAPNCTPLFEAQHAGTPQPIAWPPEVTPHPTQGGALVLFGTGKFLEGADINNTDAQAYYGVWDKNDGVTTVAVGDLMQSHISTEDIPYDSDNDGVPDGSVTARISCDAANQTIATCQQSPVDWSTEKGWYVDLPISGERATGIPKLLNGVFYVNTFIPSSSPCDAGGTGWLMALDYANGQTPSFAVFDADNDGDIDANDVAIVGHEVGAALGGTTLIQGTDASSLGVGVSSLTSGVMQTDLLDFGSGWKGRVNWREILQ
jgi:type IV pilus assembly protein PilY1